MVLENMTKIQQYEKEGALEALHKHIQVHQKLLDIRNELATRLNTVIL